jgi:hypothetical protein
MWISGAVRAILQIRRRISGGGGEGGEGRGGKRSRDVLGWHCLFEFAGLRVGLGRPPLEGHLLSRGESSNCLRELAQIPGRMS